MFGAGIGRWAALLFFVSIFVFGSSASALGAMPVISHMKTGESGAASREFIAIYNNSDRPVDVTGWCAVYSSASDVTKSTLACLDSGSDTISLILSPFGYATFSTPEFNSAYNNFVPDALFSAGLSGTSGHVRLLDKQKNEIDKVAWGSAVAPEQFDASAPGSGSILERKVVPDTKYLQDTNNNLEDFSELALDIIPASGIVEQEIITDVCPNIDGPQGTIPDDYYPNEQGNCAQDQCDNLDGLQEAVPDGYQSLDGENCDAIPIPLESSVLQITELLPNAKSTDTGNEYIEIYNPNDKPVDIKDYKLELGPAHTKSYKFSQQILDPFSYTPFSDLLTKLTLPNTSASVRLIAPSGDVVSETDTYTDPKDDQSWSFINGKWQFSNVETPGDQNETNMQVAPASSSTGSTLPDCGAGKYRNPQTNRCRTITAGDVELTPCLPGQTRNPATNRCRTGSATSNSLVPCKAGQERNPATNRCRNIITTASALVPCQPGQERNPATNRCKKSAVLGASTLTDVKDVPTATVANSTNWAIIGGVMALAAGYGIYEWRAEILRGFLRINRK